VSLSKAHNNAFGMQSRDAKRLYNAWSPNHTLTILTPNALIDWLSSLNGAANIDCDRLLPWIYNLPNIVEIFVSLIQSLDTPIHWQRHFFSGSDSARFAKAIIFSVPSMICVKTDINGTSGVTKTNGILKSGHDNVGVDINFAQIYSKAWCCSLPQRWFFHSKRMKGSLTAANRRMKRYQDNNLRPRIYVTAWDYVERGIPRLAFSGSTIKPFLCNINPK